MDYENYDPSFPDQPVVDQYLPIWAKLPAFSSKPAFIWVKGDSTKGSASTLTYEQLNNSVQSISSKLLVPLQRGDTVVILCSPGLKLVEIIFGCQRAGLLSVLELADMLKCSCPETLRGGCLAAFLASRIIVLAAEMQKSGEVDKRVLRNICERIKQAVLDEEKVELGLVVLVRSGRVPKTTSGKVQRWAAKIKFLSDVMDMNLDERSGFFSSVGAVNNHESKGKGGGRGRGGEEKRKGKAEGTEEAVFSLSSEPSRRPSLLSPL
ncbi:hypothetical protein SLEP1_g16960 [Rubroshorea leprosula]|uniref:AMP-dependent synthetase/ligase domain-containing protein n=1 Tax=Rubroshorea leprosula TaxID=152421 RepID=A0AAV5ISL6_9ROSI|nr:hypothetical protein SLEP1_g16960 [Rubroshorea leprosula]